MTSSRAADEELRQLAELMDSMGVSWSVLVRATLTSMDDRQAEERLRALMEEFRRRLEPADAELAQEQVRAAELLRRTAPDDPLRAELMDMVLAFTLQREGLRELARYVDSKEEGALAAARDKVQRGMEMAREATRRARLRTQ